ncbi:MAG: XRE family transcriptional regulator [Nitrosopumilales archaeon]|nr:MAG: XRE family transcriptional regulator [Nitrosopumilales archaeon]RPJ31541.1 MAG: XRE family transcriptional regulator [Nitrosopumilales archaeon]RPJ32815.1 MAG: XRE family transcriptional regulator [Nitrosopumilales archaeon]
MYENNFMAILKFKNLTIAQVVKDTGLSTRTVYALKKQDCEKIRLDTLSRLCVYLNVSLDQLMGDKNKSLEVEQFLIIEEEKQKEIEEISNEVNDHNLTSSTSIDPQIWERIKQIAIRR